MEEQFEQEIQNKINTCIQLGYNPTGFIRMRNEHTAVGACRILLENQDGWQEGFGTLLLMNRLDLTIEDSVINPEYAELFTNDEITVARDRLNQARTN